MNVLSLPDEMIVSFLKYTNFTATMKMQRMNKKVDAVAKKYKIKFKKVDSIEIDYKEKHVDVKIDKKTISYPAGTPRILMKSFKKVASAKTFIMRNSKKEKMLFGEKALQTLLDHAPTQLSTFKLENFCVKATDIVMNRFLHHFNFKNIEFNECKGSQFKFTDQMLPGLCLDRFAWDGDSNMTVQGLRQLCATKVPTMVSIPLKNANVKDVAKMWKAVIPRKGKDLMWELRGITPGQLNQREVVKLMKRTGFFNGEGNGFYGYNGQFRMDMNSLRDHLWTTLVFNEEFH